MTIVVIASRGRVAEKVRSNIEQVRARGGRVICVGVGRARACDARRRARRRARVAASGSRRSLNVVPLQLFAYYVALARGCDIDKPRNLAKSVTVE